MTQAEQPSRPEPARTPEQQVIDLVEAGLLDEAHALFDRVVTRQPAEPDRIGRAATVVHRAVVAWRLNRIPLALEFAAEGWNDLEAGDIAGARAAQAIGMLGYLVEAIGRRPAAVELHTRAVGLARASGDEEVLAHCLQRLGGSLNFLAPELDEPAAAEAFAQARTALAEGAGLPATPRVDRGLRLALARSLVGLGEVAAAEELAGAALADARAAGSLWGSGVALWVLGRAAVEGGADERAHDLLTRAVADVGTIEDTGLMQRVGWDLASVSARLGDSAAEARALREVLAAGRKATRTLQEGLGQALEQRRLAVHAQRAAAAAQQAAARDPLTGLANRLGVEQAAAALLRASATRGATPWLAIVDVDHFKRVNDERGHAAGDAVLREVARLLRAECRSEDLVARWAGDEFVVLLAGGDGERSDDAGPVAAERIRAAVAEHNWSMLVDLETGPTVSIGLSRGAGDLETLFAEADAALYRAKRSGRDRVEVQQAPTHP